LVGKIRFFSEFGEKRPDGDRHRTKLEGKSAVGQFQRTLFNPEIRKSILSKIERLGEMSRSHLTLFDLKFWFSQDPGVFLIVPDNSQREA
jgi:hypothetical protein